VRNKQARERFIISFLFFSLLTTVALAGSGTSVPTLASDLEKTIPVARLIQPLRQGGDPARLIALTFGALIARNPDRNQASLWRKETQELYIRWHQKYIARGKRSARQSWVSASGRAFEEHVARAINARLADHGILAVRYSKLPKSRDGLRQRVLINIVRPCDSEPVAVLPDTDILVLANTRKGPAPFCILSCKTSLHARLTESLFWAILVHERLRLKVAFVTLDLDEEFGTCKHPTRQHRVLGERFFDRMYSLNNATVKCRQLRPFDDCCKDLLAWQAELIPDAIQSPISLDKRGKTK